MAINPVRFAYHVNEQFLRYQLAALPIADPDLAQQAQRMLRGPAERPLVKAPYLGLAKSCKLNPHTEVLAGIAETA